jgi:hypothetical protein
MEKINGEINGWKEKGKEKIQERLYVSGDKQNESSQQPW